MEHERQGLEYKDENGEVRYELKNAVLNLEKIEGFSAEKFYSYLDKIISELSQKNSFKIIKDYARVHKKSEFLFGVLFYNLKDMDEKNDFEEEFDYLKQFIDYEIDFYMIINFIR